MTVRAGASLVPWSILAWSLALWVAARNQPPWGDEAHFLETVRLFGHGISIDLLGRYPEMSGPLTFSIYAGWGHVVSFSTASLRLLSPLIAAATMGVFWATLGRMGIGGATGLLALALFVFNPYVVGLTVFVFTDMLALLGLTIVMHAVATGRPLQGAAGLAMATLARQYLAFLAPAMVLSVIVARDEPRAVRGRWIAATSLGMVPLGLLVWLWEGHLAPANGIRETYLSEGFRFDPHALSLYFAAPGAYLAPLVAIVLYRADGLRHAGVGFVAAIFVLVFPVQPSIAQTREGAFTVGFIHRELTLWLPPLLGDATFWSMAAAWLAAMTTALKQAAGPPLQDWRTLSYLFPWAGVACFLVVMPFSYMPWEKYALPLLMLTSVILARNIRDREASSRRQATTAVPDKLALEGLKGT